MSEIDVTRLDSEDCGQLSGSVAELGENAGRITWANCLALAEQWPVAADPELQGEIRDHFRECGAWEDEEVDAWTAQEVSAMVIQEAAAGFREIEFHETYDEYLEACESGSASGRVFKGDDGRFYLSIGV